MTDKLESVSMNGRMAYTIMCVETFLINQYPERDWTMISRKMWSATQMNWGDWPEMFSSVIPDVLLQYDEYSPEEFGDTLSKEEFETAKKLYSGITDGAEDDPSDELNDMLNKPLELAMAYEGTVIGDGKKSFKIIGEAEEVLKKNGLALPDSSKVLFSSVSERNGWGNGFDGTFLSIILNA